MMKTRIIKNTSYLLTLALVMSCSTVKNANKTQKGAVIGAAGGAVVGGGRLGTASAVMEMIVRLLGRHFLGRIIGDGVLLVVISEMRWIRRSSRYREDCQSRLHRSQVRRMNVRRYTGQQVLFKAPASVPHVKGYAAATYG